MYEVPDDCLGSSEIGRRCVTLEYVNLEQSLRTELDRRGFVELLRKENRLSSTLSITEDRGMLLNIKFPGYKAKESHGLISYDYRVELNGVAISHVNIVIDLYNKTRQNPELVEPIYAFLNELYIRPLSGQRFDACIDNARTEPASNELLTFADDTHARDSKKYNRIGNQDWNYSAVELRYIISYIVLQEDINYPQPKFQGRKMPFNRYVEAIRLNDAAAHVSFRLADVLRRTYSHSRPLPFEELGAYYF